MALRETVEASTHPTLTRAERRRRLADAVADLADAIVTGEVTPDLIELQALALICDEHQLPIDAARVRRWTGRGGKLT